MKKLSIIVLNWNESGKLNKLYHSILPALKEYDWIMGIKDNASKDDSVEVINSWKNDRVKCFAFKDNLQNYSQGNNWTYDQIKRDDDDYILLLNNDIEFIDPASIEKMSKILDNDLDVGIVGCKLNYDSHPNIIQHTGVLFHPGNLGTPFHYRAGKQEEARDRKNRYYPIVTGAVLLTRASLFKDIGGLNEKLHWCFDDSYYCLEVQNKGKEVVYCGETNILHSESFSLKKNPVNKLHFSHNVKTFMDRWTKVIDKSLVEKYAKDQNYALYR